MDNGNKRDLSISMLRANIMALAFGIPAAIVQLNIFVYLHGAQTVNINLTVLLSMLLFFVVLIGSVFVHELIHGLTWKAFEKKDSRNRCLWVSMEDADAVCAFERTC